ncbi:unnamed protein product [Cyclocybe aegerita]|uniref:Uncharacterized protein n=1 Tax=Cyclocybe aegerita TaxID=1973307 RepID=A0A8S0XR06_CYCAE|nr:unnamed protein product [Cyclocybe aegerita]
MYTHSQRRWVRHNLASSSSYSLEVKHSRRVVYDATDLIYTIISPRCIHRRFACSYRLTMPASQDRAPIPLGVVASRRNANTDGYPPISRCYLVENAHLSRLSPHQSSTTTHLRPEHTNKASPRRRNPNTPPCRQRASTTPYVSTIYRQSVGHFYGNFGPPRHRCVLTPIPGRRTSSNTFS